MLFLYNKAKKFPTISPIGAIAVDILGYFPGILPQCYGGHTVRQVQRSLRNSLKADAPPTPTASRTLAPTDHCVCPVIPTPTPTGSFLDFRHHRHAQGTRPGECSEDTTADRPTLRPSHTADHPTLQEPTSSCVAILSVNTGVSALRCNVGSRHRPSSRAASRLLTRAVAGGFQPLGEVHSGHSVVLHCICW